MLGGGGGLEGRDEELVELRCLQPKYFPLHFFFATAVDRLGDVLLRGRDEIDAEEDSRWDL